MILPAIGVFLGHGLMLKLLVRDPVARRRLLVRNVSSYSRWALRRLGVQVNVRNNKTTSENYLIVSNHLSYLDLMVIASVYPAVFVTSIDMGEIFFLGTMAEIGGSLFIERRNRDRVALDLQQIKGQLDHGFHVVLFPEGTSSNGDSVLPFKKSLLMSAVEAGKKILPLTLEYTHIDGEPFSPANRDDVCWYGKMSFLPHLFRMMSKKSVVANLQFHMPIVPRETDTRDTLAKWTYRVIFSAYSGNRMIEIQTEP
jgi:1-acyl-sn-glycerol-3-phosphate acyltransferase